MATFIYGVAHKFVYKPSLSWILGIIYMVFLVTSTSIAIYYAVEGEDTGW